MKVPAKLHFVTLQTQRTEQSSDGYVITEPSGVRFGYAADGYATEVRVTHGVATVVRRGDSAYTLTLAEGKTTAAEINGVQIPVTAQKIRVIREDRSVRFMARYTLGQEVTTVIIRAYF